MAKRIVLIGYMASGKTTIGKRLAEALKVSFLDLDEAISEEVQMTIPEIFQRKGEVFFRKKEAEILERILVADNYVLATGGGTPCYGMNMQQILAQSDHSLYLKLTLPNIVERIRLNKNDRPLVSAIADEELEEFLGKHLFERSFFYNQAQTVISCDEKSVEAIVDEIKTTIQLK